MKGSSILLVVVRAWLLGHAFFFGLNLGPSIVLSAITTGLASLYLRRWFCTIRRFQALSNEDLLRKSGDR